MTFGEKKQRARGEPWVWLSAMGLGMGMLMIVGILGLIAYRGLEVFWPKSVVSLEIRGDGKKIPILGEIVLEQQKKAPGAPESAREIQIFQGNREHWGQAFTFVDKDKILFEKRPENVIRIERLEYGKAIGFPIALQLANGHQILNSNPTFDTEFQKLIETYGRRRKKITQIEKDRIGKLNRKLEQINLALKKLNSQSSPDPEKIGSLEDKKSILQENYQHLAKEAKTLRSRQDQDKLIYRLADGQDQTLPLGQILHYYYPNRLNITARLAWFFKNVGSFLTEAPREANTEGGVFPAIFGTLVMTVLMSLAVVPFGVLGAIYLSEYAKQGVFVRLVRVAVNNLAGVPSIVFGVFGLGFFVYLVGGTLDSLFFSDRLPAPTFGTGGLLWASLTLALMTVPVVIVSTEEALGAVSRGVREGALACGASKWQTIKRVLLPAAAPGIMTGTILAMARGAGEVAPLMLVGVVKMAPTLPINGTFPYLHLDQKFMHLGFHIFDLGFQSPDSEAAKPMVFATTLLLIAIVLVLNIGAIILRERLRKKYAAAVF